MPHLIASIVDQAHLCAGRRRRALVRRPAADRGERGSASVEFLLMVPILLLITFLIVQWAIHLNANQIVQTAARQGAVAAAAWNGTPADASTTAQDYLNSMGKDLQDPQVTVSETPTTVTVTVSGNTMEFVPGTHQHVTATLTMPLERIQ